MNCPYCNSPVLLNDVAGNPWYKCGTTKTFRSASCVDREPLATELRNALARIKRLEEAGDEIEMILLQYASRAELPRTMAIEQSDLSKRLCVNWRKAKGDKL